MIRKLKIKFKQLTRPKYYENSVEASYSVELFRKIFGFSVYSMKSAPGGRIYSQFSFFGFISFVSWYVAYFWCVYNIYLSDQTILRSLYDTKLQRYGDEVERFSTLIYMIYAMWKIPFDVNLDVRYMQLLVDIDKAIERLDEPINFTKYARSYFTCIVTFSATAIGALITWLSFGGLKATIALEIVFHMVYSDTLILVSTARYCGYLHLLASRYKILNRVLASCSAPKARTMLVAVRGKTDGRISNMVEFQKESTSERIRTCGKIYGMLYEATETANRKFGLCLGLTMLLCLVIIVLYMFYFMEATASGLFRDVQKYVDFLVYAIWQTGFAFGVIYLNVYFSMNTVQQAKETSFVTHNIINNEINPLVRTEALHLSLQILHQRPVFTARGLCRIDYMLLLEGARAVVTFLVILLQFATHE